MPTTPMTPDQQSDLSRYVLDSIQALIRALDTKAQVLLASVAALGAVVLPLLATSLPNDKTGNPAHGWIMVVGVVFFVVGSTMAAWMSARAMSPKGVTVVPATSLPHLIFPQMITARHANAESYATRLSACTLEDVLAEYSHQILQCSKIYNAKREHINTAEKWLMLTLAAWILLVVIKILVLTILPK